MPPRSRRKSKKSSRPFILGIAASHNGAACLLHGDEIVVAIQEERLTRVKRRRIHSGHDFLAARYCLESAGITPADLQMIITSTQGPPSLVDNDVNTNPFLRPSYHGVPTVELSHHLAHAYSAYATSGFREAAVLVIDGGGSMAFDLPEEERAVAYGSATRGFESISLYAAGPDSITALDKALPEGRPFDYDSVGMSPFMSLGGMFMSASKQIFGDPSDAGKVMGLAPYGRPTIPVDEFLRMDDGRVTFTNEVIRRFQGLERWPLARREYEDLAASVQAALEVALDGITRRLRSLSGLSNLCYAGGVALNSIANEKIVATGCFEDMFIIPAAEDSGLAVGAAYYGLKLLGGGSTAPQRMQRDSIGHTYTADEITADVTAVPKVQVTCREKILERTVDLLLDGKIGAWFDGGSELGPRSLGQRTILCDARRDDAKEVLNARVKHREAFRPFAPVILAEDAAEWFDFAGATVDSPFMLRVCSFKPEKRALVPGVVHVDGTGRVQTVTAAQQPRLHALLREWKARTGVPLLLNTSLNVMGEPIVETPADALWCLILTDLDFCTFPDRIVTRDQTFTSVADLVPTVAAEKLDLGYPVRDARLDLSLSAAEPSAWVRTRWGEYGVKLDTMNLTMLAACDGKATLGELSARLSEPLKMTPEKLAASFRRLRMMGIVRYS